MSDFIEKRRVRMANQNVVAYDAEGNPQLFGHVVEDFVPLDILDAYIEDAKKRWSVVQVIGDSHDPGPDGDDGLTHFPHHLSEGHPLQGQTVDSSRNIVEV